MKDSICRLKEIEFKQREEKLLHAKKQELIKKNEKDKLHIVYVMTWTGISGGSKIILEHANRFIKMGHKVTLISHDKKPDWFPIQDEVAFIQVPWGKILGEKIPKCDIIVATYWREIYECVEQKIAPVVYFEQGDFHLFDTNKLDNRTYNYINKQLSTINYVYTVSTYAKEMLKEKFGVNATVIPNAVDENIFYYEPHVKNDIPAITIIGSEEAKFKRIENILQVLDELKKEGYDFSINWITPTKPKVEEIKPIVNPKQIIIGNILRNTDIYICASMYESFCLPVLEAMTCGAAVITTNNGGNMDFVEENVNALIIKKDDLEDMKNKIIMLLQDVTLRNELAKNGTKTSKKYSWDITMKQIEKYYNEIASYTVV